MEGKRVKTNPNENVYLYYEWGGAGGTEFQAQGYGHRCVTTFRFLIELIRHQWRGEKKKFLTGPQWIRDNSKIVSA